MKIKTTVDAEDRLDVLLAEMPIQPREDFTLRTCSAIAEQILEANLSKMPVEVSADFADRVMHSIENGNTVVFPRFKKMFRFIRASAVGVVALSICVGIFALSSNTLNDQIASVLESDPELAQLAASDDGFSFNELIVASQLLTVLNEHSNETAELFAYYEN